MEISQHTNITIINIWGKSRTHVEFEKIRKNHRNHFIYLSLSDQSSRSYSHKTILMEKARTELIKISENHRWKIITHHFAIKHLIICKIYYWVNPTSIINTYWQPQHGKENDSVYNCKKPSTIETVWKLLKNSILINGCHHHSKSSNTYCIFVWEYVENKRWEARLLILRNTSWRELTSSS